MEKIRIMLQEFNAKSLTLLHHFNTEKPMQMQSRHLITSHSPKIADAINNNMETNIKKGIAKGGAYFMGFVLTSISLISQTLNANIQLNKANQERTIKVPGFAVTSNYVSIITVRLKSSTDAGDNNNGNDDEHLFNPKSTFIVEIEKTYVGIHNTNVDVE